MAKSRLTQTAEIATVVAALVAVVGLVVSMYGASNNQANTPLVQPSTLVSTSTRPTPGGTVQSSPPSSESSPKSANGGGGTFFGAVANASNRVAEWGSRRSWSDLLFSGILTLFLGAFLTSLSIRRDPENIGFMMLGTQIPVSLYILIFFKSLSWWNIAIMIVGGIFALIVGIGWGAGWREKRGLSS